MLWANTVPLLWFDMSHRVNEEEKEVEEEEEEEGVEEEKVEEEEEEEVGRWRL